MHKYTMRYDEFLIERVLNLHTPKEKMPYAQEVWDMLQRSYENIGGFKSSSSVEELVNEPGYWKVVRRNGRLTMVNIYKKIPTTNTYKVIASATETEYDPEKKRYKATKSGFKDYDMVKTGDIKMKRGWAEVSDKAEKMMQLLGAKPVPNKFAELLTGKHILEYNSNGYHYTRLIQGKPFEKIIYGFVKLSDTGKEKLLNMGIDLHTLPDNIKI